MLQFLIHFFRRFTSGPPLDLQPAGTFIVPARGKTAAIPYRGSTIALPRRPDAAAVPGPPDR